MKKLKLITHDGSFHTDDVFACAALSMMLEKDGKEFEIFRTRDEEITKNADFVFDVGGIYEPDNNRFDHHQVGGAGSRDNGIGYSSFGLVWKKFGIIMSGSEKAKNFIDNRLVAPIDAWDNGLDLVQNKYEVSPYYLQHVFGAMKPTWREENLTYDEMFTKAVAMAREILSREIIQTADALLAEDAVISAYNNSVNKKIIVLDKNYPCEEVLQKFPETLYVVYPRATDNIWGAKTIRKNIKTFENRKNLPASWGGLQDQELQKITGVADAVFCHKGLFLAGAKSREGAIKLAKIAVES